MLHVEIKNMLGSVCILAERKEKCDGFLPRDAL